MPDLNRLCLTLLWHHPIKVDSLPISARPLEGSSDYDVETIANAILRAMIMNREFAEGVMSEIDDVFGRGTKVVMRFSRTGVALTVRCISAVPSFPLQQ